MSTIKVFENWKDQPLDEILWLCQETVEDSEVMTVKRWRKAGGKVLGHFQVYFPEEIAHAAGMLPMKMFGASVETRNADSRFGSFLCSILKTSLEQVLSGRVELDMFVTHPICDAARNLAPIWGRNYDYPCQILYLPQNPNSSYSVQYLKEEYERIQKVIEKVAGREITDDDLKNSITIYNRNRELLRELYRIKKDMPWLISINEAYVLMAIGGLIRREEHNEILESVLPMIEKRKARKQDRIKVVFEGGFCEQPPLDMLRTIGRSCYVVDDDLLIGMRYILEDIETDNEPLHAMAEAYINKSSYSPVQHDLRKPKEKMLKERVKNANAEAVIITAAKMCEPGLEEQVTYTQEFDKDNTPYFVSEFEENMSSFDHLEMQLETFVENLIFD
ncbi:MAG TPA: 2-hydroxyacyl-CoA dehydratase [Candidatus Marinimicrobia bacterium]|jgi:benzoyl-CoA reductase subunit C|nr:2-hydroxyacyl-CoA dehydratase [Candidatus Neomarinimicrobiota bacterium]MDP6615299.1 2-hydroxyacyl-CoA dehydratase [Candidatus Neomarinimicrobiota bacterium]MEE1506528.1 2-hydroxyacyl-CoA dehydratase [Candidatus Neomarinimicrobiota bacterium]HJL77818.1 2-hydroxyacyl-CoA dehydratase [Candidatus Neomarinimicrobiota bacterium]HJM69316.1 2-hydroxyacyl-CoA dehydratase [Candidatus Neomarinimicrobiota bacterium]|tara:strand:+ start:4528 stop:5697 length:1170 start_codon:yes stop_codon:yes gene_type:complete